LSNFFDFGWLASRFTKEFRELSWSIHFTWGIVAGIIFLTGTIISGVVIATRSATLARSKPGASKIMIFSVTSAASGLLAILFVLVVVDDKGLWHYRFLAVPVLLNLIFLASVLAGSPYVQPFSNRIGKASAVLVSSLSVAAAAHVRQLPDHVSPEDLAQASAKIPGPTNEAVFQDAIDRIQQSILKYYGTADAQGLSEYWIAADLTVRSRHMYLGFLNPVRAEFRFIDNNANDTCASQYSFVIRSDVKDEPRIAELVSTLGEPHKIETTFLPRHGQISILFYDASDVMTRVVIPGREKARTIFPTFYCSPT
jgi:hypothetical protein